MTWLYVPSTSSAYAPAAAGSIAPLNWQSQVLALSCTWRGSHSPSPLWSRRLKTVSWLQRLSGAMCEPSRADHGAASWIASLAASRANPTASPAAAAEVPTNATSGARRGASSSKSGLASSSLKTLGASSRRGLTKSLAPSGYDETYKNWVTRLRAASSARRTFASRMSASASSLSVWRTPTDDSRRGGASDPEKRLAGGHTLNLQDQVLGFALSQPESAWPTPAARDFKGVDRQEVERKGARPLNEVATSWSTPRASDGEKGGPNQSFGAGGVPLTAQAAHWSTPRVSTGDYTRDQGKRSQERLTLQGQAKWSTPSVADTTGGRKARSGERSGEMLNNSLAPYVVNNIFPTPTAVNRPRTDETIAKAGQNTVPLYLEEVVQRCDLQALETLELGASLLSNTPTFYQRYRATTDSALRCEMRALRRMARDRCHIARFKKNDEGRWESVLPGGSRRIAASTFTRPSFRRQLNARFVEWLMSWPPGLTSFDCSETALQTHKAAWRSELASMTSLPAAPPAQLSLFG